MYDLSNILYDSNIDTNSDDEIDFRRTTGVSLEISPVELEETTFNQASDQFEQVNDHQLEISQLESAETSNEDQYTQYQDPKPFGYSLPLNNNHPLEMVIYNSTTPLITRGQMLDEFMHSVIISPLEH